MERARLMAHELVKSMRDHYAFDVRQKTGASSGTEKREAVGEAMRRKFFGMKD